MAGHGAEGVGLCAVVAEESRVMVCGVKRQFAGCGGGVGELDGHEEATERQKHLNGGQDEDLGLLEVAD